ncbi:MAG: S9 family peptidase [Flavobacteriales bacterium]|nr:S9 family peptidase [Flavobacteriales bacterium]
MMQPIAAKKPKELTIHGHTRTDAYFWMNERDSPEVLEHLKAENAYTDSVMEKWVPLRKKLFQEMKGRIKETDMSVPYLLRGYSYYVRYEEGFEYPLYCRKKAETDAVEEVILNVNTLAEGHSFCDVQGLTVSPDNTLLAYGIDTVSRRQYTLKIRNLQTGEMLNEAVENTDGSYVWAADNRTLFYDVKDEETLRTFQVKKHVLGQPQESDSLVFEEKDETFYCSVSKSKSEEIIFISSFSTVSAEERFIFASEPDAEFRIIQPRRRDHLYFVQHFGGMFYIRSNADALNFKLMRCSVQNPGESHWETVIPQRNEVLLEGVEGFEQFLVLEERENGLTHLRVLSTDGNTDYRIDFGEPVYTVYTDTNYGYRTQMLRFVFSSLKTPMSVFEYNMQTREKTLLKQQEVVGGHNPEEYITERLFAHTPDGEKVPMSVLYKKGLQKNGQNPALLYGYGSYGITVDPTFSSVRLSLVDRGFVYVIAHIRGGQDLGRYWYENGKMLNKKNTFFDFIRCAETLIEQQYTSPRHLYAMGGSAGGLLMGAVMNMRPDLFNGLVAAVPFVDVVTTMLDESIPLTTGEFDEWGNPKQETFYQYILSYSPYDNVEAKAYPNLLVTTGYHDSQVQYWEPAKWVAKLRELKTDDNLLLFHCDLETGHGGKSGRFERLKEIAMEYAFILGLEGEG